MYNSNLRIMLLIGKNSLETNNNGHGVLFFQFIFYYVLAETHALGYGKTVCK